MQYICVHVRVCVCSFCKNNNAIDRYNKHFIHIIYTFKIIIFIVHYKCFLTVLEIFIL